MRIEKETEVTIKVRIGYVWPDDFESETGVYEYGNLYHGTRKFRTTISGTEFVAQDMMTPEQAQELIMVLWEKSSDLLQASEITIQDLGIVQE